MVRKSNNSLDLLGKIPVLVFLGNAISAYLVAHRQGIEHNLTVIGRPTQTLSSHMLRDDVDRFKSQVCEDTALFAGDRRRRIALTEANQTAYLSGMNDDFGHVEERDDVWYSIDEARYMPLTSAIAWKAEMDGYSFFDPGEDTGILWEQQFEDTQWGPDVPTALTDYESTKGRRPGARSEIMNLFGTLTAGPYRQVYDMDIEVVQELMNNGMDVITAMAEAVEIQDREKAEGFPADPFEIGYEPNVEDRAWVVDDTLSRGFCDAEDSREAYEAYLKELDRDGPKGLCWHRASHMKFTATQRNDRFIRELGFIAGASPKDIRARYLMVGAFTDGEWVTNVDRSGDFWKLVESHKVNNPEPGLAWLTSSHTILVNFAYRRRLGIAIKPGLLKSATWAADNVSEQMQKHCDIGDFNLADIEGQVNGYTEYFEQLGKYYADKE